MGKLTGKGKHRVKVENYSHTNMISKPVIVRRGEYKCRLLEMHLKLRDQQLKTISYTDRLLCQNLMVTTNQKFIIDIHPKKRKESKHNTRNIQITTEENKRRKEQKTNTKTTPKQLTRWQ